MKDRVYEVEIYTENGQTMVYISADGASGCKYKVSSPVDVGKCLADYISNFDLEEGKWTKTNL